MLHGEVGINANVEIFTHEERRVMNLNGKFVWVFMFETDVKCVRERKLYFQILFSEVLKGPVG